MHISIPLDRRRSPEHIYSGIDTVVDVDSAPKGGALNGRQSSSFECS